MAAEDPEPPAGHRDARWQAVTATERGAAHRAAGAPNQDAVATAPLPDGVVAAVADGHGHGRHFRSARGARLAVAIGCQAVADLAPRLAAAEGSGQAEDHLRAVLAPDIVTRWREAVHADVAAEPFSPAEEAVRRGDDATVPYGTTLLLAIGLGGRLLLSQIGDGDIVGIRPGGTALLPVPGDPLLDGRHTTSLCSPSAASLFRVAAVELAQDALLGVLLATDGYGNAQVARAWEAVVSADLAGLITTRGPDWLAGQLPVWAARCASVDGSADDTTIALLLGPAAAAGPRPPGDGR